MQSQNAGLTPIHPHAASIPRAGQRRLTAGLQSVAAGNTQAPADLSCEMFFKLSVTVSTVQLQSDFEYAFELQEAELAAAADVGNSLILARQLQVENDAAAAHKEADALLKKGTPVREEKTEVTDACSQGDDIGEEVCPDVHEMFAYFDAVYFDGLLTRNAVVVEWSSRMKTCAGTCTFRRARGMMGMCRIALSEPLLKFRGATNVKETLLHEMIHAAVSWTRPWRVAWLPP